MNESTMKQIFIGGCQRSGTTMLGSMIGSAADGICIPEAQFIINIYKKFPKIMNGGIETRYFVSLLHQDVRFRLWRVDLSKFTENTIKKYLGYDELLKELVITFSKKKRKPMPKYWVDHTPMNIKNSAILLKIFPEAKFIHIVRDGRAVAVSLLKTIWGPKTVHTAARYWLESLAYCFSAEEYLGKKKILRIRYEDVLESPEMCLKKICQFCGIKFNESMLQGGDFQPSFRKSNQHRLVGSPPEKSRALSWQKEISSRQVEIFESIAGEVLENLGYKTIYWPHTKPLRGVERYVLDFKEFFFREVYNRMRTYRRLKSEFS